MPSLSLLVVPKIFLKCSWILPLSVVTDRMVLSLLFILAVLWKNVVLTSLSLSHLHLARSPKLFSSITCMYFIYEPTLIEMLYLFVFVCG